MYEHDKQSCIPDGHTMLRERDLSDRWAVSRRTLQRWRAAGCGPAWHLFGGTVRYRHEDVLQFEIESRLGGTGA